MCSHCSAEMFETFIFLFCGNLTVMLWKSSQMKPDLNEQDLRKKAGCIKFYKILLNSVQVNMTTILKYSFVKKRLSSVSI